MSNGAVRIGVAAALAALAAGPVLAAADQAAAPQSYPMVKGGGDLRVRQELFDNIPIKADPPGVTRNGENNYLRIRPRLWGELDFNENVLIKGRLTAEMRHYWKPDDDFTGHNDWNAPDETIVDNLYLDWSHLAGDTLDIRIGRQDLVYGNGRVILEGTPKDGSRTIYMDAAKITLRPNPANNIDLLGIYNQPENELAINSQDRDLTGLAKGYNDMTESGGGVYWKNKSSKDFPFEAYYLYKNEEEWDQPASKNTDGTYKAPPYAWQSLDGATVVNGEADIHTVGVRLMPALSEEVDVNLEAAYQAGERGSEDQEGYMVDALLNWKLPVATDYKPTLSAGWYVLSGDDPDTSDDEGWDPLWARWPQYSELYVYSWDAEGAARWSNVSMPHVDFSITPCKWYNLKALVGYMFALEDDGPGDGKERGLLFTAWNNFTLKEGLFGTKDKLSGHILVEVLEPGDYYKVDDTAYFLRWELMYSF